MGRPGRPTELQRRERLADAEQLILEGWSKSGELRLAKKHGVTLRTVRAWRPTVQRAIRENALPGATAGASLEDALERLEIVFRAALKEGNLRTARACLWDRAKLLDLVPRHRVEVGGTVTLDVNSRKRVDVSVYPPELLAAIAGGVTDEELDAVIDAQSDEDLAKLFGRSPRVVDVEAHDVERPALPEPEGQPT